jgi:hypothetical protein
MQVPIFEKYPMLWHYTTATGLDGILRSQQLWATDFRYLNDDEELRGFFIRKFPSILRKGIDEGINKIAHSPRYQHMIEVAGDEDKIKSKFYQTLYDKIKEVTLELNVYVTSFCFSSESVSNDGLLSQWRGYGHDGGYAIVFDTKGLSNLLDKEQEQFTYPFWDLSDVDYHDDELKNNTIRHPETIKWERKIIEIVSKIVVDVEEGNFEKIAAELAEPTIMLAIRHKHQGFKEECEVRIVIVLFPNNIIEAAGMLEIYPLSIKTVLFRQFAGVLVPYISLFDNIPENDRKLPIKRIIVGPHPDKWKRQKSVQMMLDKLEIEATVSVSDIPFLGR